MLISPGKVIRNYVAGDRKNYQPPVSYFLVWNAIFLLVVYLVNKLAGESRAVNFGEYFGPAATTRIAISHLNMLLASLMPLQALYVWLIIGYGIYPQSTKNISSGDELITIPKIGHINIIKDSNKYFVF